MEIKTATVDELEARRAELLGMVDADGADLDVIQAEAEQIHEELESRRAAAAAEAEKRGKVAAGAGNHPTKITKTEEKKTMDVKEFRNSHAYAEAYKNYIVTEKDVDLRNLINNVEDEELRTALLTQNATNGTVPVPTFVEDIVRRAWDEDGIMRLVKKSYIRGNVKVGFEAAAGDATVHTEGGNAVAEEDLTIGVVTLIPQSIKKWKSLSDEVLDLAPEAFLTYIYEEIAHQIARKAAFELLSAINACGTESGTTQVAVPVIESNTASVGLIAEAIGNLAGNATNPVVVINPLTWAEFKKKQYDGKFNVDPFEGLQVIKSDCITAFSAATTGVTWAIVGDFAGAQANFPNGEGIDFKIDDKTDMAKDLVRVLGRQFVAVAPVAPKHFVKITKVSAS